MISVFLTLEEMLRCGNGEIEALASWVQQCLGADWQAEWPVTTQIAARAKLFLDSCKTSFASNFNNTSKLNHGQRLRYTKHLLPTSCLKLHLRRADQLNFYSVNYNFMESIFWRNFWQTRQIHQVLHFMFQFKIFLVSKFDFLLFWRHSKSIDMAALDRTDRLHYEQLLRIDWSERFATNVQYTIHIT